MSDELDPRVREALEALKSVPPRDPRRAAIGRAAFLAEAERLKIAEKRQKTSSQAVSLGPWARLKGWIRQKTHPNPRKKEVFAMPSVVFAILAALSLLFGGGALTVKAADAAVPGDVLYPVDLAVENLQLALASTPDQQAQLHLAFAQERAAEIQQLIQEGRADQVEEAVQNLEGHLAVATQLAAQMAQEGQAEAVRQMEQAMAHSTEALQQAIAHAPEPAQQALQHALMVSTQMEEQVRHAAQAGGADTFRLVGTVEQAADGTLMVNGVPVQVAPGTLMPQDIKPGDVVHVEGLVDPATGAWVALKVTTNAEADHNQAQQQVTFKGTVESVSDGQIVVGGQVIHLTEGTRVKGNLEAGAVVEIQATMDENGALVAVKVEAQGQGEAQGEHQGQGERQDQHEGQGQGQGQGEAGGEGQGEMGPQNHDQNPMDQNNGQSGQEQQQEQHQEQHQEQQMTPPASPEAPKNDQNHGDGGHGQQPMSLMGIVQSVGNGQVMVNGQIVQIPAGAQIQGMLQAGSTVQIQGVINEDGSFTAQSVQVISTPMFNTSSHQSSGTSSDGQESDGGEHNDGGMGGHH